MLATVVVALALQATLAPDDVPAIVDAVVGAALGGEETVVVAKASADAFGRLLPPSATIPLASSAARYTVRPAGEVLDCLPAPTNDACFAPDGVVFLTIESVATGAEPGNQTLGLEPGQLHVGVSIRRPRRSPMAPSPADTPILVLEEQNGGWEVVDVLILVP